ncbi:MAG TPA: zinc ribbon domain-containing protein [Bacillota bacterium]
MYTALILIVVVAAGFALFRPLMGAADGEDEIQPLLAVAGAGPAAGDPGTDAPASTGPANKEAVYATLAELEYDYATHKLAKEDYEALRTELEAKALEIIRREEAVEDLESIIEAEVQAELEGGEAKGAGVEVRFCPACGVRLLSAGQRFCHKCATRMPAPEAEPCDA